MHLDVINVTFYDAVNVIHNVIKQLINFHILRNSCLTLFEIIKLNKSDVERKIDKARKLSILPTSIDIFDIR